MRKLSREETVDLATWAVSPGQEVSIYGLARTYGVSDRWARELRCRVLEGRPLLGTARLGRPPAPIPEEERAFVLECEDGERLNPVALERRSGGTAASISRTTASGGC